MRVKEILDKDGRRIFDYDVTYDYDGISITIKEMPEELKKINSDK